LKSPTLAGGKCPAVARTPAWEGRWGLAGVKLPHHRPCSVRLASSQGAIVGFGGLKISSRQCFFLLSNNIPCLQPSKANLSNASLLLSFRSRVPSPMTLLPTCIFLRSQHTVFPLSRWCSSCGRRVWLFLIRAMEFQKQFPTCLLHTLKKFSCHSKTCTTRRNSQLSGRRGRSENLPLRSDQGGCWKMPGQVRSWGSQNIPSHSDRT
jgi:hypothetical protein